MTARQEVVDVRDSEILLAQADHLLAGVRRLCVRRHYIAGESTAELTTCPVVSPWPGREDKICGADLYPGFLFGQVGDDPLSTIRRLIGELRAATEPREVAGGR